MRAGLVRRGFLVLLPSAGIPVAQVSRIADFGRPHGYKWAERLLEQAIDGLTDKPGRGRKPVPPPQVAAHVVTLACERPDLKGRSLSQWDCAELSRQAEFIAFLAHLEDEISPTIHIVCDNLPTHRGKQVRVWLEHHPRFRFHFTPVHCSWMNQIEQWFSILQRKRFRIADFASKADLGAKILQFTAEWNEHPHPFNWTTKSVAKVMADAPLKHAA
jgi:transposase